MRILAEILKAQAGFKRPEDRAIYIAAGLEQLLDMPGPAGNPESCPDNRDQAQDHEGVHNEIREAKDLRHRPDGGRERSAELCNGQERHACRRHQTVNHAH